MQGGLPMVSESMSGRSRGHYLPGSKALDFHLPRIHDSKRSRLRQTVRPPAAAVKHSQSTWEARKARAEALLTRIEADRSPPRSPYKRAVRGSLDLHPTNVSPQRARVAVSNRLIVEHPPEPPAGLPRNAGRRSRDSLLPVPSSLPDEEDAWLPQQTAPGAQLAPPAAKEGRRRRRQRKRDDTHAAAALLTEHRFLTASEAYLKGLSRCPGDERLARGFAEATAAVKLMEPQRWSRWPWAPEGRDTEGLKAGSPPGRLPPPIGESVSTESVTMSWESAPSSDSVAGYELEVAEVNAILGPQPWRKAYRGKLTSRTLRSLGREVAGVRARVRAFNSAGKGLWSQESQLLRLKRREPPQRREIEEIPVTWLHIDLAGLPELKEDNDPAYLSATKRDLLQALHDHRTVLKILFRYYALAGITDVDDDPNTMTMIQFGNFCRGCKLIDNKNIIASDIDRLFLRAVRVLPMVPTDVMGVAGNPASADHGLASALSSTSIRVTKFAKAKAAVGVKALLTKGQNLMNQSQFIAAVVRLAAMRYPEDHMSLAEKLSSLCTSGLTEHAFDELQLIEDDFSRERLRSRAMGAVLHKNAGQIRQVFTAYSTADQSDAISRRSLLTMNVKECSILLEDVGVFDKAFSAREYLAIFVRVNIDDDLYYQKEALDTSSELVFDEFEEVIARVFFESVWLRMLQAEYTASLLDQDGDGDLDDDDIDDLFNECDADQSGTISLDELQEALGKRLNAAAAHMFAEQLVALADEDGSGTMSRDELASAIRKIRDSSASVKERPGDMERAFDTWLSETFLPPAITAAAKRKLMPKRKVDGMDGDE
jgi:hypothetical protein